MKIELKNIKHSAFASQETHCFEATVYVDGKREFIVSNEGHGGCDNYHPLSGAKNADVWKRVREIDEILGKEKIECGWNDPKTGKPATMSNSLGIVCSELVNEWLRDRETKKGLKRICYVKPGEEGVYQLPAKHKPTEQNLAAVKGAKWWNDDYILLNELPFNEARAYF